MVPLPPTTNLFLDLIRGGYPPGFLGGLSRLFSTKILIHFFSRPSHRALDFTIRTMEGSCINRGVLR